MAVLLALLVFGFASAQNASAANVTVTNTNDAGAGSLRQAISSANAGDTVVFDASVTGTITLTGGQLTVGKNLTISGPGANLLTVSGNNASRVFAISGPSTVTISGLTIRDGVAFDFGGGIFNDRSTLTVNNCTLTNNRAPGGDGGGIANIASVSAPALLTVTSSTFAGNSADLVGGNGGLGGGIYNDDQGGTATVTVRNSTFTGNSAVAGGAIENENQQGNTATVTLTNSTLSGNLAGQGGGIRNADFGSGTASLTIGNTILQAGFFGENIFSPSSTVTSLGYNLSSDAAGVITRPPRADC